MGSALKKHTEGRDLPAVREKARELAAASVSANTRRAYEGALRRLQDWLDGRTLDDTTLAEYLAVRFYAKLGGQASPVGPATARVLAGSSGGSVRGLRDTGACIGSLLNQTPAAKR